MTRERLLRELEHNHELWEKNYEKLVATQKTPAQKKYVKLEEILTLREIRLRKELGLYANDPCPIPEHRAQDCSLCTGYYVNERFRRSAHEEKKGIRCPIKEVMCEEKDNSQ